MRKNLFLLFFLFVYSFGFAQNPDTILVKLKWLGIENLVLNNDTLQQIAFENCAVNYENPILPNYSFSMNVCCSDLDFDLILTDIISTPCSDAETGLLDNQLSDRYVVSANVLSSRGNATLNINMCPIRRIGDGAFEKILSCNIVCNYLPMLLKDVNVSNTYASQSVLATGNWFKFSFQRTGIHKISYEQLISAGVSLQSIDNVRLFFNGGGVLPEKNSDFCYDDLIECPIQIHDANSNGVFESGDYLLFYGRGPVVWKYNATQQVYVHQKNPYSDYSYVFVTTDLGVGKRIDYESLLNAENPSENTEFLDFQVIEEDKYNLNNMGRTWYFDIFSTVLSRNYSFNFPNSVNSRSQSVQFEVASRNFNPASFRLSVNGNNLAQLSMSTATSLLFASTQSGRYAFNTSTDNIVANIQYVPNPSGTGYLDYIAMNVWRELIFTGSQMLFQNPELMSSAIYKFKLRQAPATFQIWDVSNAVNPQIISYQRDGSEVSFTNLGGPEKQYIAFDESVFFETQFVEKTPNQNLHSLRNIDYLIVAASDFLTQANRLKTLHEQIDGMTVFVTTPEKIFNEFSCGSYDISAIRNFVKMLYSQSDAGRELKYLCLFGDASFDYKNVNGQVCFVPSYETIFSTNEASSFCTDDFFGCMDDDEGDMTSQGITDVGIGRLPVQTIAQATQVVNKIEAYMSNDETTMRPWRNMMTFVSDDAEWNQFFLHSEQLSSYVTTQNPNLLIDKIYLDAYEQINTPGGQKAPQVNKAINDCVEKGTLLLNYTGHAGEIGWAAECILENNDIFGWRNLPRLPLVIAASCEFGRFDDHSRTSSAEYTLLNAYGGSIATISAARVTYGSPNIRFNMAVMQSMLAIQGGDYVRLGDIVRMSKTVGDQNDKVYTLLGDPALRLAFSNPNYEVETLKINGQAVGGELDTIKALQKVSIEGAVTHQSAIDTDFNGVVYITVFDKLQKITTRGDEGLSPREFTLRKSVIFKGKAEVKNGLFQFNFTVPKDINYSFGSGLISYYATNETIDANGSFSEFCVGGYDNDAEQDEQLPEIKLFIDDLKFVDGGLTGQNPTLLAHLRDANGINTTGAGIGHNIIATLSGATSATYQLNDYYEAPISFDEFGILEYKMNGLNDGEHTLKLKVWDVYNNSNEAVIHFVVSNNETLSVDRVSNYPNPVEDYTYFIFDHNQVGNEFDVNIQIYNITGQPVHVINTHVNGTTNRTNPIFWNARTSQGMRLNTGVYVYRVIIVNEDGSSSSDFSKLIIK